MKEQWTWAYPAEVRIGDTHRGRRVTNTVRQENGTWAIVLDEDRVLVFGPEEMLRVIHEAKS